MTLCDLSIAKGMNIAMKKFSYVIKDELGIHARPAGMLVSAAKETDSVITISKGEKSVVATRLMMIMGMGLKCGDEVTVTIEGGTSEDEAFEMMKKLFMENL